MTQIVTMLGGTTTVVTPRTTMPVVVISPPTAPVRITTGTPGPTGPRGPEGPEGPEGDPGADALWVQMTQAEFDALQTKNPQTLYVIIG